MFLPSLFFYYLPISSPASSSPSSFFLLFHISSLSALPVGPLLTQLSSCPSSPRFRTQILYPASQFQCYLLFHCSSLPMSFLISPPVLQSHYYVPFASRLCTWKFNHGEALDYAFYPVLFFCSVVFLFTTIWTDFYLNVLCSAFLFSFLFQYVSVLYSTTQFWCLLALHVLFLPRSSAGLLLVTHSIVLFGSIYLLIIHCTLFPFSFSHFAQADVFPCLATTPVRISFLTECLSSKLRFYHTSLPPKYVHQPYWLAPLY